MNTILQARKLKVGEINLSQQMMGYKSSTGVFVAKDSTFNYYILTVSLTERPSYATVWF